MLNTAEKRSLLRVIALLDELHAELYNLTGFKELNPHSKIIPTSQDRKINNFLYELGIPASLTGYDYLKYIFNFLVNQENYRISLTPTIYPMVAKHFNKTAQQVDHNIRHAIQTAVKKGNHELLNILFPHLNSEKNKITNADFIYRITEYLQKGY